MKISRKQAIASFAVILFVYIHYRFFNDTVTDQVLSGGTKIKYYSMVSSPSLNVIKSFYNQIFPTRHLDSIRVINSFNRLILFEKYDSNDVLDGWCFEEQDWLCVYKYYEKGTLRNRRDSSLIGNPISSITYRIHPHFGWDTVVEFRKMDSLLLIRDFGKQVIGYYLHRSSLDTISFFMQNVKDNSNVVINNQNLFEINKIKPFYFYNDELNSNPYVVIYGPYYPSKLNSELHILNKNGATIFKSTSVENILFIKQIPVGSIKIFFKYYGDKLIIYSDTLMVERFH